MNAQLFGIVWAWKARKAATTVEQAIAPLKPSVVGYLTVRRAGAAVSASQPAEYPRRRRELGRHRSDPGTPMSIESNPTDSPGHTHH